MRLSAVVVLAMPCGLEAQRVITTTLRAPAQNVLDAGSSARRLPNIARIDGLVASKKKDSSATLSRLWAIGASALLPGAGQLILRQQRWIPYVAAEAFAWRQYRANLSESKRWREEYRTLAAEVARAAFSTNRPVGSFQYYERLEKFERSGVFEFLPGGGLEPERDTTTYNGSIWLLARRTFWKDINNAPDRNTTDWQRAEEFYRARAVTQAFQWSWAGANREWGEYRARIRATNRASRDALQSVGLIIGNHVLSMVDAAVTIRVTSVGHGGSRRFGVSANRRF